MTSQTEKSNMVNLTIDGLTLSVPKGTTVYHAIKKLGLDVPIFCYQDRMPPFGACRVCLVEVEKMGKPQTSCTLEATEGMVVKTQSDMAVKSREEILEFLLINHPLDCPVCDRGGECPLQDNTMKFGPGKSRFFEEKRHFSKPYALGPVLMLDRERCIQCARCTRFGDIVAGDHALEFIDRGYKLEVGTPDGKPAESKFIGNTIMICPVGALTSEVYRFRARPWDNEVAETTCTLCPVGCSMYLDSRDGEIMRTRSRENHKVNDIWMCDKGWFGYQFSDSPYRLVNPMIRRDGKLEVSSWDEALTLIARKIKEAIPSGNIAAFGGNPLTTEENFLFQKLMRDVIGVNHIDHRIGTPIFSVKEEGLPPGMEIPINECDGLDYAVICGLDLTEEFPVIWLRLKQAINRGAKVIYLGHYAPEIRYDLTKTVIHAPGNELDIIKQHVSEITTLSENGKKGAIFIGRQYLDSPARSAIISELQKLQTIPNLSLNVMEGRENSLGARLAGMRPDLGPLGERINNPGLDSAKVLEKAAECSWDVLYVAGANPALKYPAKLWSEARKKLGFLVVQDMFITETAQQADVVLPTLCYVEKEGHFINIEGRVQRIHPGKVIPTNIYSDAEIFMLLSTKLGKGLSVDSKFYENFEKERISLKFQKSQGMATNRKESTNKSGLAATFAPALFDHGVRMKHNKQLVQLAKKPYIRIHPNEGTKRQIHDGDRVTLRANDQTITGNIKLDDWVSEGTVVLPLGFPHFPVHNLGVNLMNGLEIELKKEG